MLHQKLSQAPLVPLVVLRRCVVGERNPRAGEVAEESIIVIQASPAVGVFYTQGSSVLIAVLA